MSQRNKDLLGNQSGNDRTGTYQFKENVDASGKLNIKFTHVGNKVTGEIIFKNKGKKDCIHRKVIKEMDLSFTDRQIRYWICAECGQDGYDELKVREYDGKSSLSKNKKEKPTQFNP